MARFDLYPGSGRVNYFVDLQADLHSAMNTRLVAPVLAARKVTHPVRGLHVKVMVEDAPHYVVLPMAAAMPLAELGTAIGSLASDAAALDEAADFLLRGY